ncbi:hypothetical protein KP509_13G019600 [Ceratopteris richardii]|nr:hypothetical protein KP509_13G019600 [Ceratopteris richardii]
MYVKCGALMKAEQVLQELPTRNVVSWSTIIAGYAQHGQGQRALQFFDLMQTDGVYPNAVTFLCALKACGSIGDIAKGEWLHDEIRRQGLLKDESMLGNALVDMYAKCGAFTKAHEVLTELPMQDVVSWNALIAGLIQHHRDDQALLYFELMQCEGIFPDGVTFLSILKACGNKRALPKGKVIHEEVIRRRLLGENNALGNALVDMYAKCGAFAQAWQVFEALPARNAVSWNSLITEYVQQEQPEEALRCFELMGDDGLSPDEVTFLSVLKACGNIGIAERGEQIHNEIRKTGLLSKSIMLGNALVDMYAKCGAFSRALEVLEELSVHDVVSWNALIAGYSKHGRYDQVFDVYNRIKCEGLIPSEVTFLSLLKVCGSARAADKGEEIHNEIARLGLLKKSCVLGTALIDMYAKCGSFKKAEQVLEVVPGDSLVISWNALISGYVQQGHYNNALECFHHMQEKGVFPDSVTYLCILNACANIRANDKGEQIHEEINNRGLLQDNLILGNALLDMYAKCGTLKKARELLIQLPVRDAVSWSTLIAGFVDHGENEQALNSFEQMRKEGIFPNTVSLVHIFKAYGTIGAIDKGEKLYDEIAGQGLFESNVDLATAVVDMYARCGFLGKARQVLDGLPVRDVVSWNALITGCVQQNEAELALSCFEGMQLEGLCPDAVTFLCILKVCGSLKAVDKGEAIHNEIVEQGLLDKEVLLANALIDMYAKCGTLSKAQQVFEGLSHRDIISWTALIGGYVQQARFEEALSYFGKMQHEGMPPNLVTFLHVLKACGSIGLSEKGNQLYNEIARYGLLENDMICSALVDMYVKCGALVKAQSVLADFSNLNVASWNALVAGYAEQGEVENAVKCIGLMQEKGLHPDAMTFSCILKACCSNGLVDSALVYMMEMTTKYGIKPDLQHLTCLIDVFARSGHLDKAMIMMQKLPPIKYSTVLWSILLGSCQKWGDINVAKWALQNALQEHVSVAAVLGVENNATVLEAMMMESQG